MSGLTTLEHAMLLFVNALHDPTRKREACWNCKCFALGYTGYPRTSDSYQGPGFCRRGDAQGSPVRRREWCGHYERRAGNQKWVLL